MKSIFLIFLGTFALLSCKKEERNPYLDIKISEEIPEIPYKQLKYKMKLPDTLVVNNVYKATLEFESDFDTIIPPLQVDALSDSTKVRLITFYRFEPVRSPMKFNRDLILKDSAFVLNKSIDFDSMWCKKKKELVIRGLI